MKTLHRLFAIACLSFAGLASFAGCAADTETTGIADASEMTEIRYSPEDIKALAPGAFLRLDLTLPNTVYGVTYADIADLDRILVVQKDDQYVLRDRFSATANDPSSALKLVVLSGELMVDPVKGESVAPLTDGDEHIGTAEQSTIVEVSCDCPCCLSFDDVWVCCG